MANKSHEASGKITEVNEPQENEHYSDVISIYQAYLSFKKYIELIEKYDGKTQRRRFYEDIHDNFFENNNYFTSYFLKTFIHNANVT